MLTTTGASCASPTFARAYIHTATEKKKEAKGRVQMGAKPSTPAVADNKGQTRAAAAPRHAGPKRDDQRTPKCESDDLEALARKWDDMRQTECDRRAKPVIIMIGNAGVGKSSTIAGLIPSIDAKTRASLNICRGGSEGTTRQVRIEADHLVCIDTRGKRHQESARSYAEYIVSEITRSDRVDDVAFVVGVIGYDPVRDSDIDSLYASIKAVCAVVDRPFIVLHNQRDKCRGSHADAKRLKERLSLCRRRFASIERPTRVVGARQLGLGTSLLRGVFAVAAAPSLRFDTKCPASPAVAGFHDGAHAVTLECDDRVRTCRDCKTVSYDVTLESGQDLDKDSCASDSSDDDHGIVGDDQEYAGVIAPAESAAVRWRAYKATIPDKYTITPVSPLPEGVSMCDPAMKAVFGSLEGEALDAVVKACSSTVADRMREVRRVIRDAVKEVWTINRASECDGMLCRRLAAFFDLPKTGDYYGQHGTDMWLKPLWTTDMFQALLRMTFAQRALQDYTAAWGIFHALKFRDMHAELLVSYTKAEAPVERVECANAVAARYTADLANEICKYAEDYGIEEAYDKYLVASTDPRDLDDALACLSTSERRA
ncbi:YlqF related GTPase incomplete domain containing protein [Pandoravirus quercus]|uniref:YlqF related GTPase incomplete domain containing protein n=1 Tax=Pandoravirus quercus TaxID=2107709 RepID=A0A2U7U9E9_9VIRU|nr:YlqF related GTPase incomplete domain containing protein [Pandoravirus quercus]AVK75022.1 YlqF related GTPase incomplete domain containing protein [Pandoravirus quercus]